MEIRIVIDERIVDVVRKVVGKKLVAGLVVLAAVAPVAALADGWHVFEDGTTISAEEVNDNFANLGGRIEGYESAIQVDEGGNVGIGTESPSGKLHVHDEVVLGFGATSCPEGYYLSDDADGSGDPTQDDTCSSDGLVVTADGNVGIGTTAPGKPLSVKAASADTHAIDHVLPRGN